MIDVAPSKEGALVKVIAAPELIGVDGDAIYTPAKFEELYEHTAAGTRFVEGRALYPQGPSLISP